MTLILGETVSESFYVGAAGQTFTRVASFIDGGVAIWNPTFTELGGGFYRYSYDPLVAGVFEWTGTATDTTPIEINFDVEATTITIIAGVTGSNGTTRAMLRRRISKMLGNMVGPLTATANGSTTTFIDTINLKLNDSALVGREAYFYSGANSAISRTISASNYAAGSITVPAVTSTLIGDVAEIHNTRAQGWTTQEIHDELDGVLREASESLPSFDREDIATVFDADSPYIAIPATFRAIYQVDWLGNDSLYHTIPAATDTGYPGWWVNRGEQELVINGDARTWADTYAIRIYGAKVYSPLSTDASTTSCNEEWLVNQVCANLLKQGAERVGDGSRDRWAIFYQDKADKRRDLLVHLPPPDFTLV